MLWHLSTSTNSVGRALADRHYSRLKAGSRRFVKLGRCLTLLTECGKAVWVTSWPFAEYVRHEWAGAWECSLFRNESEHLASSLIVDAVGATLAKYGKPPELGMITFIDPTRVKPTIQRGMPSFGFSYIKAGFAYIGSTKGGKLCFQLKPEQMPPANPARQPIEVEKALGR